MSGKMVVMASSVGGVSVGIPPPISMNAKDGTTPDIAETTAIAEGTTPLPTASSASGIETSPPLKSGVKVTAPSVASATESAHSTPS